MTPLRIQLSRKRGWRMPPDTVKVSRPTKFGNPFIVGAPHPSGRPRAPALTNAVCVEFFRRGLKAAAASWVGGYRSIFHPAQKEIYDAWETVAPHLKACEIDIAIPELRGKNLACWCRLCPTHKDGKPFNVTCTECEPCHADVLGELANKEQQQ